MYAPQMDFTCNSEIFIPGVSSRDRGDCKGMYLVFDEDENIYLTKTKIYIFNEDENWPRVVSRSTEKLRGYLDANMSFYKTTYMGIHSDANMSFHMTTWQSRPRARFIYRFDQRSNCESPDRGLADGRVRGSVVRDR